MPRGVRKERDAAIVRVEASPAVRGIDGLAVALARLDATRCVARAGTSG
jgi:hypothetical protein